MLLSFGPSIRPRAALRWNRLRDALVYRPLAFAESAESLELAHSALRVQPGETVAGITSSGDLLLSLLSCQPGTVRGFDANPTQTALARLKCLLCREASLERALGFLGLGRQPTAQRYATWSALRGRLGRDAALIEPYDLGGGLLNCGMSWKLMGLMCLGFRTCLGRSGFQRLVSADTTAADRLRLHSSLNRSRFYRRAARPLLHGGSRLWQHFLYPPALCRNSDYPRRALQDLLAHFRRLFEIGFHENPVFCRYLTGRIPPEQSRHLYAPAAWANLKRRLPDVRFETCSIEAGLRSLDPASVDAFYLSNAPDYLGPEDLRSLSAALSRAARPGARLYLLSLEPRCPFERHGIPMSFSSDRQQEHQLHAADPVGIYPYLGVRVHE